MLAAAVVCDSDSPCGPSSRPNFSVPATLEVSYAEPFSAEKAAELPFVRRESGRTVSVFCRTVMEIYRYADMMASFKG